MKLLDITLWCDCENLAELKPIMENQSGRKKTYKCEKCGRIVRMKCSLVTEVANK